MSDTFNYDPVFLNSTGTLSAGQGGSLSALPDGGTIPAVPTVAQLTSTPATASGTPSVSSGQNKANGWFNYLSSLFTGAPSGNGTGPGGTNPGATTGGALSNINFGAFFTQVAVVILGLIFIAVGLAQLGHDAPLNIVKGKLK